MTSARYLDLLDRALEHVRRARDEIACARMHLDSAGPASASHLHGTDDLKNVEHDLVWAIRTCERSHG